MDTTELRPGDVVSYSAGTTRLTGDGFRIVERQGEVRSTALLATIGRLWPELVGQIFASTPMVIQAYPATVADFSFAVCVDTYLSERVGMRTLRLAADREMPAIIVTQPCFAGHLVAEHLDHGFAWPSTVVFAAGGYPFPASLEHWITAELATRGATAHFVHLYGVAEVEGGCLIGRERDDSGRVVLHRRDDISAEVRDDELWIGLNGRADHNTGDRFESVGDGFVSAPSERFGARTLAALEDWGSPEWRRRTGYVLWDGSTLIAQQRQSVTTGPDAGELPFHTFCARTGMQWLRKPEWRDPKETP